MNNVLAERPPEKSTESAAEQKRKADATSLPPETGPALSVVGDTYRVLIRGEQTGGKFAAIDMLVPHGGGPGPHSHADFEESFYIIDGEIEVKTEDRAFTAHKGTLVRIPRGGMVHSFQNRASAVAHLLCLVAPSGLERFFEEIGTPVAPNQFLPRAEMGPEEQTRLKKIAEKYGQIIYPPDYLDRETAPSD